MSDKKTILSILESVARLLELKGENPFKIRAYGEAIRVVETAPLSMQELSDAGRLMEIDGIGKALAEKIAEIASTGKLEFYEKLREEFPGSVLELFEIPGLGGKKIKALYGQLKIASVAELESACEDGRVAELAGFGEKTAKNLLAAIALRSKYSGFYRYGEVAGLAEFLLEDLRSCEAVLFAQIAGSFRRRKEVVHDLDIIAATRAPSATIDFFSSLPIVQQILAKGETKSSVILKNGMQCDLRAVSPEEYPFALSYFTGSKEHNVHLRGLFQEKGWSLNEYRISRVEGKGGAENPPEVREEADLYRALGLEYIEPELRENLGEFAAAKEKNLPRLLDVFQLRGVFHVHTTDSDGLNSLEEMVAAAEELGLEYIGISDHSKSSVQANGLSEERLREQMRRVREINEKYAGSIRVFSGVECDILKDGALDYPDDLLAELDFVVASVHSSFSMQEAAMTARVIRAMENPYVTMLGHPTGRLLLSREGYPIDIQAVLEAAARTRTIVELNANPARCDLDWRWWPTAKKLGVRCAINPDAHCVEGLRDLYFGVGIARKGWLEKADVVNSLSEKKVVDALRVKRG